MKFVRQIRKLAVAKEEHGRLILPGAATQFAAAVPRLLN